MAPALLAIGLGLILYGLYLRRRSAAAAYWPSVSGRITESRLVQVRDPDSRGWDLRLTYTYRLPAGVFQGHRISFFSGDPARAARRYPAGRLVDVFYDPRDPASAVLEQVAMGRLLVVFALGIALSALGCLMAFR